MGRSPRRVVAVLLALAAAGFATVPVAADSSVELSPEVRESLLGLQERWNRWLAALYQANDEAADELTGELLGAARRLGMRALPDLSRAAAVKAVEAARENDLVRAQIALEAAERLDPGRPETAFARARVAWRQGGVFAAAGSWVDGWTRLAGQPFERRLWLHGAGRLSLTALLLAGGLFVAALMAVRGPVLFAALERRLARLLPTPLAKAVTVGALVWPLLLPGGPAWLVLYWSVLLWADASRRQRLVVVFLWLLTAGTPLLVAAERDRLAVDLSPPVRAVEDLVRGRLSGSLFSDLGVLPALLPEDPAVLHLLADLHRRLGQWDRARTLYRELLELEPANASAMIDLGSYHYERGDYGGAVRFFLQAAEADPQSALAHFNLTQAYSKAYLFTEMRQAMTRARALADLEVSHWMNQTSDNRVPNADGGLARADEIRLRLAASWRIPERQGAFGRAQEFRSLLLALACVLAAVGLQLARRLGGEREAVEERDPLGSGLVAERWRRVVLPGVPTLVAGGSLGAYGALLVPSFLLLLPSFDRLGFELPITAWSGPTALLVALAGWVALITVRVLLDGREA